eukprot:2122082-Pyramimonas_sp.AAC.1
MSAKGAAPGTAKEPSRISCSAWAWPRRASGALDSKYEMANETSIYSGSSNEGNAVMQGLRFGTGNVPFCLLYTSDAADDTLV